MDSYGVMARGTLTLFNIHTQRATENHTKIVDSLPATRGQVAKRKTAKRTRMTTTPKDERHGKGPQILASALTVVMMRLMLMVVFIRQVRHTGSRVEE